jgi:hypothetical protein
MRSYLLIIVIFFAGCSYLASWDDVSKTWVGTNISKITELWGKPDIITKENGNLIYKYNKEKLDPSCIHYWIVDTGGIITGYRYTGYCRPIG